MQMNNQKNFASSWLFNSKERKPLMKVASVENISDLSLRKFLVLILDFLYMMTRKGFYIFEIAHNLWRRLLATGCRCLKYGIFKKL